MQSAVGVNTSRRLTPAARASSSPHSSAVNAAAFLIVQPPSEPKPSITGSCEPSANKAQPAAAGPGCEPRNLRLWLRSPLPAVAALTCAGGTAPAPEHPEQAADQSQRQPERPQRQQETQPLQPEAKWGEENPGLKKGARLSEGKIRIESGLAKLRFASGAKVTLEGPAEYEIISNDLTRLVSGRLSAKIPKSAIGFKVDTPTARVLDLGTAFGVDVDDQGATEVAVFEGEVEVELPDPVESRKGKRLITHGNSVRTEAGAKEISDTLYDVSKFRKTWPVTAGMVSTAGMVKFAPPGLLSTLLEHEDDDHLVILPERGSFTVSKKLKARVNITVPGEYSKRGSLENGRLEPGRVLASYLVQFNPVEEGKKKREQKNLRLVGIATFERPIVGVITATGLLRATDKTLGGHSDPLAVKGRGLEIGTRRPVDTVILSDDRKTLVLDLHVSGGQIDQIRVLVEGEE